MGFIRTRRRDTGGGSGQTLAWEIDELEQTDPFGAPNPNLIISLTQTPVDADAIIVYSQNNPLDTVDYNYLSGPPRIEILFAGDPAVDYPDTGVWRFRIQYPYAT